MEDVLKLVVIISMTVNCNSVVNATISEGAVRKGEEITINDSVCITRPSFGRTKQLDLMCPENSVISFIDVTSGVSNSETSSDPCENEDSCCTGDTVRLIVDKPNCYWKTHCCIQFPTDPILLPDASSCGQCTGEYPNYMTLKDFKCFPEKSDSSKLQVKINICDTDSETENGIHIDGGLLLSHNYYPWSYEVRDFDTGRVCRKRFWGETGKKMIVSFLHNVDLAEEDKFRIRTKTNATVDYSSKTLVFGESDKYVQFEFTVSSGSKGGGGFAVCLKMVDIRDYDQTLNACDMVMEQNGDVTVVENEVYSIHSLNPSFGCLPSTPMNTATTSITPAPTTTTVSITTPIPTTTTAVITAPLTDKESTTKACPFGRNKKGRCRKKPKRRKGGNKKRKGKKVHKGRKKRKGKNGKKSTKSLSQPQKRHISSRGTCVTASMHGKGKRMDIRCPGNSVISSIDVTSGTGYCENMDSCCSGITPSLLIDRLSCYWQPDCSINFPTDIIIVADDDSCERCVGSTPQYLILREYLCFSSRATTASRQQAKLNICDDDDVTTTDIHMDGLLLSHSDYPWEYEVRNFVVGIHSANVCSKKLWLSEGWKLLVTIHDIDLAEGDSLIMRTSSKTIRYPNLTKYAQFLFEESDSYVQFELKVSQESNGGKGFVVCFKHIKVGLYDSSMNACDTMMERIDDVKVTEIDSRCSLPYWACPVQTTTATITTTTTTTAPSPTHATKIDCPYGRKKNGKCKRKRKKKGGKNKKDRKKDKNKRKNRKNRKDKKGKKTKV